MNNALYNSVRLLSRSYPSIQTLLDMYIEEADPREKREALIDLMDGVIEAYYAGYGSDLKRNELLMKDLED